MSIIAQDMLTTFNDDPDLLEKVITGNESWVYGYDIETKANYPKGNVQKSQDRKQQVKFGQMWRFCSLFFDCNGMVHHESLPQDCTVNKEYNSSEKHRIVEKPIMDFAPW